VVVHSIACASVYLCSVYRVASNYCADGEGGVMDGNKKAFIADVFGIKESEVPEMELEEERDRWYGAAQERMIQINGLESTCRVQGKLIADQRDELTALRARVALLEKAVEWALNEGCATAQNEGWDAYEAELRRRAKEG
jgi:hypothetical protein